MADIDISYDPITVNSGPVTLAVNGLDNIKLSIPEPIRTDSQADLRSDSKVDVKTGIALEPIALDQCLRISLGPLPPTRICLPSHQHVGFSIYGMEIFGITLSGEAQVLVGQPQKQTTVVGRNHVAGGLGGDVRIRLGS